MRLHWLILFLLFVVKMCWRLNWWKKSVQKLGRHIGDLINVFNPEQVIIGGEFSKVGEYLLPPVISAVRKYTLNLMYKDSDIVLSELKEKANVIGSSLLSRSKICLLWNK